MNDSAILSGSLPAGHTAFLSEVEAIARPIVSLCSSANIKRTERDQVAASLVCEIAELFVASLAVLRSGASDHVFAPMRSMLDARADLLSLLADDQHLKRMRYENGLSLLGYMEGDATRPTIRIDALRDEVEVAKNEVTEFEKQGFAPRRPRERFQKAGIEDEFVAYQLLATSAQSDMESLKARHIRDGHLVMCKPVSADKLEAACGMMLKLLYGSVRQMPHISDLDEDEIEKTIKAQDPRWFAARHSLKAA